MVNITGVLKNSYADKAGIKEGDAIVSINKSAVRDVLDYRFYMCEKALDIELCRGGEPYCVKIKKGEYDDIGLEFETFLMDKKHSCRNGCIFCFIDQLPKGMRDTLYFKDDDSRLSFLMGNYVTLTNVSDEDVDRIIKMHMSPINISVHTTNKELRVKMLRNKRAGDVLDYLKRFADAKIEMNCQIVLCKGINDGAELENTMHDLASLYPYVPSVSIVPCGMTKYRDGLYNIEPFTKEESAAVVRQVEDFARKCRDYYGDYIFYCGDEFYIEGGLTLPDGDYYGEYRQIENGVGMISSMKDEFDDALGDAEYDGDGREVSIITGALAYDFISGLAKRIENKFKNIIIHVYKIENDFFGRTVTVAGLVTGGDILNQLSGKPMGDEIYIPSCMLKADEDMFLDGVSVSEIEEKLGAKIVTVKNDGYEFVDKILGGE
ncbi:MAG: DUF512 domain-containing protein [Clostridiales bacterium]|nr:DUF512 domain-containing protein [Clostridiales bacterium]